MLAWWRMNLCSVCGLFIWCNAALTVCCRVKCLSLKLLTQSHTHCFTAFSCDVSALSLSAAPPPLWLPASLCTKPWWKRTMPTWQQSKLSSLILFSLLLLSADYPPLCFLWPELCGNPAQKLLQEKKNDEKNNPTFLFSPLSLNFFPAD